MNLVDCEVVFNMCVVFNLFITCMNSFQFSLSFFSPHIYETHSVNRTRALKKLNTFAEDVTNSGMFHFSYPIRALPDLPCGHSSIFLDLQTVQQHPTLHSSTNTSTHTLTHTYTTTLLPLTESNRIHAAALFKDVLCGPVLKIFHDPVEKCRALAVTIFRLFVNAASEGECAWLFADLTPVVRERVAGDNIEPAEELRLELLQLLTVVLNHTTAVDPEAIVVQVGSGAIQDIVSKSAADAFPDIKILISEFVVTVAGVVGASALPPSKKEEHFAKMAKSILPNVAHQRSKVRQSTLRAVSALIRAHRSFSQWVSDIFPSIAALQYDHNPSVRKALVEESALWVQEIQGEKRCMADILLLVLSGISDEIPDIQTTAIQKIEELGENMSSTGLGGPQPKEEGDGGSSTSLMEIEEDETNSSLIQNAPPEMLHPFSSPPSESSQRLVRSCLKELLTTTVHDVSGWKESIRSRATGALQIVLLFAGDRSIAFVEPLLQGFYKGLQDDDNAIIQSTLRCASTFGYFVDTDAYVTSSLTYLQGANSDPAAQARCLVVLKAFVDGDTSESLAPHVHRICVALSSADVCSYSTSAVRIHVLNALSAVLSKTTSETLQSTKDEDGEEKMGQQFPSSPLGAAFWAILQVDAVEDAAGQEASHRLLASFAEKVGLSTLDLYDRFFLDAFKTILGPNPENIKWKETSIERTNFVCLMDRGSRAVNNHVEVVLPIVMHLAGQEQHVTVRADSLSILRHLLSSSTIAWSSWGVLLLRDAFLPNTVWKAGKAAAALRLQAVSCIRALLAANLLNATELNAIREGVVPVLLSNLDDDDFPVRVEVIHSLRLYLDASGVPLFADGAFEVQTEVLKRLDDSRDEIRLAALQTLEVIIRCSLPPRGEYDTSGERIGALLKALLIHLDDTNVDVQEGAFTALSTLKPYDTPSFTAAVEGARGVHRSPVYLDRLLAL